MKEGKFLSEILDFNTLQRGKINIEASGTGAGKTTAYLEKMPEILGIKDKRRVLYLASLRILKDKEIKNRCQEWGSQENKPYAMCYQTFANKLKDYEIWSDMFDLIVADEIHSLFKWSRKEMSEIFNKNPDYSPETIGIILSRESASYRAFEALKTWSQFPDIYIVGMTATPEKMIEKEKQWNELFQIIQHSEQVVAYEIFEKYYYSNLNKVLLEEGVKDEKRAILLPNIKMIKEKVELINQQTDRKAIGLWALDSKPQMDKKQLQLRQYLIDNEKYPEDIDDILFTPAYIEGINICDEKVSTTVTHTSDKEQIKQFNGRIRRDIKKAYYYDNNSAKNEKELERKKQIGLNQNWIIPEKYLNLPLDTKTRKELLQKINYPKGWTTFKKYLETSPYSLLKKRIHGNDFYYIVEEGEKK